MRFKQMVKIMKKTLTTTLASVLFCATAYLPLSASATDYTWTGGGTDDLWSNPENWGETANYPGNGDRAIFPAGQPITVTISQNDTVGTIDLRDYSFIGDRVIDVTFRGAAATGTNCVLTVKTKFDIYAPLGTITLDNAAIKVSAGELKLGKGRSLHLINGANLYSASRVYVSNASTFELSGRSVANINGVTVEGNARLFSIDDSSVFLRDTAYFDTTDSAGALIRFSGSNPLIYWSANKGAFYFSSRSVTANMVFSIPAGGYAAPPIQCTSAMAQSLFYLNSKPSTLTIGIDPDSPFYSSSVGTFDQPLVEWSGTKSIDTSNLVFAEVAEGGTFLLGTSATAGSYDFTPVASFSGTAKSMGVRIVSPAHDGRITVSSDASQPLDGYSPALGVSSAAAGTSVTATAPTDVISNGVHYVCTGYTLTHYVAGTAATPDGDPVAGVGNAVTFTAGAGGASVQWRYAADYAVTATTLNDAGGAVALSSPYVSATAPVTLIASTATDGMEFQYWRGDVPYSNRYDNPLVLSVDRARNVEAFFGATAASAATRLSDGIPASNSRWHSAASWTDGVIPGTNDTAYVRSDGYHSQKRYIHEPAFLAVRNLVVSNANVLVATGTGNYYSGSPSSDQNGYPYMTLAASGDSTRTDTVGMDVFGDVILEDKVTESKSGSAVFVGGQSQQCFSQVNIGGDLRILNGAFQITAGYPFIFVTDPNKAVTGPNGILNFPFTNELWRGSNFLKVAGDTVLDAPSGYAENFIQVVNDFRTGAAVWLDLHDVNVGEGAAITAFAGGYGYFAANGVATGRDYSMCPGGHSTASNVSGGSHAGRGGSESSTIPSYTTYMAAYGFAFAPLFPGGHNVETGAGGRGGGSVRLDCDALVLDGGIVANGKNGSSSKGGSAGGAIWVVCDTFTPGANCKVTAEGGSQNGYAVAGGGGGRILLCEGLAAEQINALYATHAVPEGVTSSLLADKLGARASAAALVAESTRSGGEDGTAWYLVNTAGMKTLTVAGDPENAGTSTPHYGPQAYDDGDVVAIAAPDDAFVADDNRSRRLCTGYTLTETETGSVVSNSAATSGTIVIDADYTLTWELATLQHAIDVSATVGGAIATNAIGNASSVWQDDGAALSFSAVPDDGYVFKGWYGEVETSWVTNTAVAFTANRPRMIRALFAPTAAGSRTWTGGGDGSDWLDPANWSPAGLPGVAETVTIPAGATVRASLCAPLEVGSLTVAYGASLTLVRDLSVATTYDTIPANATALDKLPVALKVNGDFDLGGSLTIGFRNTYAQFDLDVAGDFALGTNAVATLYAGYAAVSDASGAGWAEGGGRVRVGGAMTIADGAKLKPFCDAIWGAPVVFSASSVTIAEGGAIDAYAAGWGKTYIGGVTYSGSPNRADWKTSNSYCGGTYAGVGGYSKSTAASQVTYGNPFAPYMPGSPGMYNHTYYGGGAVRIHVSGSFRCDGAVSADGYAPGTVSAGGGSGGSVWITCGRFESGAAASITAKGGSRESGDRGAGGGGRICIAKGLTQAQIAQLYATGTCDRLARMTAIDLMDDNAARPSRVGGEISAARGTNPDTTGGYDHNGTDGTAWYLIGVRAPTRLIVQ